MSFESILRAIVEECPGSIGAALMGSDGIPIVQVTAPAAADATEEVTVLGVEFGRILEHARKAADAAEAGATLEISVQTERFHLVLHPVDPENYLLLALAPHGNVGKGRYLLRRHELAIREEL